MKWLWNLKKAVATCFKILVLTVRPNKRGRVTMPYENVDKHDELVNKLVEKIKKDYVAYQEKNLTKSDLQEVADVLNDSDDDLKGKVIDIVAMKFTLLSWVKHNIVDTNGHIFRCYITADTIQNIAIYYVDETDLNILLGKANFLADLEIALARNDTYAIEDLCAISEQNISELMITRLERCMYKLSLRGQYDE